MVTTVKLQNPFEYSWWVILVAVIVFLIAAALLAYAVYKFIENIRRMKPVKYKGVKKRITPELLFNLKRDYVAQIDGLVNEYNSGKISKRDGYQDLSQIIRKFVHEVTGINVETLTKKEIKALGIRHLDNLMVEYYVPEFAEDEKAEEKNLVQSCQRAMGVIKSWR